MTPQKKVLFRKDQKSLQVTLSSFIYELTKCVTYCSYISAICVTRPTMHVLFNSMEKKEVCIPIARKCRSVDRYISLVKKRIWKKRQRWTREKVKERERERNGNSIRNRPHLKAIKSRNLWDFDKILYSTYNVSNKRKVKIPVYPDTKFSPLLYFSIVTLLLCNRLLCDC